MIKRFHGKEVIELSLKAGMRKSGFQPSCKNDILPGMIPGRCPNKQERILIIER